MEFLLTYGWAILVVLVAIGALAHFGVLNPKNSLPEFCFFFPGISCTDFKVDTNGVTLVVINGMGKDLAEFSVEISGMDLVCRGDSSPEIILMSGDEATLFIDCRVEAKAGTRFAKDLKISYLEIGGFLHNRLGEISTNVEK